MKILVPKHTLTPPTFNPTDSLFFLAGPVRGGGDWQHYMVLELQKATEGRCVIACPCRWNDAHPLARYFVKGRGDEFPRQLDWERHFLGMAGELGCIIFWLGCESEGSPHPGPEPYAMDTRGELGEWRWRMKTGDARVVIGAEKGFHGLSQIQRNFNLALGYEVPVYDDIPTTARRAVARAREK